MMEQQRFTETMDLYQQAWTLLLHRLQDTCWLHDFSPRELTELMAACLVDAGRLVEEATPKLIRDTRPPSLVPVFPWDIHHTWDGTISASEMAAIGTRSHERGCAHEKLSSNP